MSLNLSALRKNWRSMKNDKIKNPLLKQILSSALLRQWMWFLILALAASVIFYVRFPNNFQMANFYAEDGRDFALNIYRYGLLQALLTKFNGYFVWGMYLLSGLGYLVNQLFYGGDFTQLPKAMSLVSYLFLGSTVALPTLLFWRELRLVGLAGLVVLSALVPLPGYDYAIIGTIGNLKWAFLYIAFLLVLFRFRNPNSPLKVIAWVDLGLLICAYTNATVYFLIPIALIPYLTIMVQKRGTGQANLLKIPAVGSLALLCSLLLPQVVIVMVGGLPSMPGYLDSPYRPESTIEIFVARTLLFGFLYAIYHYLSNLVVLLSLLVVTGVIWRFGGRQNWATYMIGLYAALVGTLLFVVNRPGVSEYYGQYTSSGPDIFFYPQNLIIYFVVIWFLVGLSKHWRKTWARVAAIVVPVCLLAVPANKAGSWGRNNFMAEGAGTFAGNAVEACATSKGNEVPVQLYPVDIETWEVKFERKLICESSRGD
jgi:hypothetical protein